MPTAGTGAWAGAGRAGLPATVIPAHWSMQPWLPMWPLRPVTTQFSLRLWLIQNPIYNPPSGNISLNFSKKISNFIWRPFFHPTIHQSFTVFCWTIFNLAFIIVTAKECLLFETNQLKPFCCILAGLVVYYLIVAINSLNNFTCNKWMSLFSFADHQVFMDGCRGVNS